MLFVGVSCYHELAGQLVLELFSVKLYNVCLVIFILPNRRCLCATSDVKSDKSDTRIGYIVTAYCHFLYA